MGENAPTRRTANPVDRSDRSGDHAVLRFTPPPPGWAPPDEAGRAILRVVAAVKKRRDANRKDAA
jgi:hypothetical protein